MLKSMLCRISCAAILAVVAFSIPASAEMDFDRGTGVDVPKVVFQARKDAAKAADVKGEEQPTEQPPVKEDQVERRIVVFRKSVAGTRRMQLVRNTGGIPTKDLRLINAVAVIVPKVRIQSVDAQLLSMGEVLRVEKDFVQNWLNQAPAAQPIVMPRLPMKAPAAKDDKTQTTPWGIDRVNAGQAWQVTRGAGVKVAVVDTGIDYTHPDLRIEGGYNCIDPDADYKDDNGHGTHVAGTIAAQDNDEGVVGVAPDVRLFGVKVLSASGSGTFADVIAGIQWTAENGMDIANFSLGASQGTEALADAVKAAADAGVAIIAAAGNSGGSVGYPAAYPEALAVAASDSKDGVAYFSSRGPEVDVIAPGVDIRSTYMGGGYESLSGTSMATPHVVGLAALAVAARGIHGIDAVRSALRGAAAPFPDTPATEQGAGLVDAGRLVR